jgi:RNA polymerase primary sigma factor
MSRLRPSQRDLDPTFGEPDAYDRYYRDVSKVEPLDAKTEHELLVQYKSTKDTAIRSRIIQSNLRFVVKLARRFCSNNQDVLMDLISSGNMGLMRALEKYEPDKNVRFLTYATSWVLLYMRQELRNCDIVSMPVWRRKALGRIKKAKEQIATQEGRQVETRDLSGTVGMSDTCLRHLEIAHFQYVPEETISNNAKALTHTDSAPLRPDEQLMRMQQRELIESILRTLPIKERSILCNYYGLAVEMLDKGSGARDVLITIRNELQAELANNGLGEKCVIPHTTYYDTTPWSLRRIGATLCVSSERVRQVKFEVLKYIKRRLGSLNGIHKLEDINSIPNG